MIDCRKWSECSHIWVAQRSAQRKLEEACGRLFWHEASLEEAREAIEAPGSSVRDTGYPHLMWGRIRRFNGAAMWRREDGSWWVSIGYPTTGTTKCLEKEGGLRIADVPTDSVESMASLFQKAP